MLETEKRKKKHKLNSLEKYIVCKGQTCKANKTLVLNRESISDQLKDDAIIAMQADWTRPDDEIARFLERYERFGIPFNIVFGPGAPSGIALPEILTPALVLDALNTASIRTVARE